MGGEIAKSSSEPHHTKTQISPTQHNSNGSAISDTNPKNNTKLSRKKEKIIVIAKNKHSSVEKHAMELIHKNNPDNKDYDMIYGIIGKHFFMQTLNTQARDEIITTMSLCKVKEGTTLFKQAREKREILQSKLKIEKFDNGKKIIVQGDG